MTVYDPYTGESSVASSNPENKLKFGTSTPSLDSVKFTSKDLFSHVGINPIWETEAITQNVYESAYARMFEVRYIQEKQMNIHAGDVVNLNLQAKNATQTAWGGLYSVTSSSIAVDKSSLVGKYQLHRGDQQFGPKEFALEGAINSPNSSKGQSINIRALSNSQITKGAATQSGPFTFVTTKNPD